MSKNGFRLGAIALSTAAVAGLGSTSAFADSPGASTQSLSTIQAKATAAITLRTNDLHAAISRVNATGRLGSSSAALVSYLQADLTPLQVLSTKIAGDTTVAAALAASSTIFSSYRVLALVLPAARLTATADVIELTDIPNLTALSSKAASKVNAANRATLQPLIDDLSAQILAATNGTAGVSSTLLGYTPSQWNANHDLLAPSRGSVRAATANVVKAKEDVQQIRTLRTVRPVPSNTTTPTTGG
jgi:glycerate kinase